MELQAKSCFTTTCRSKRRVVCESLLAFRKNLRRLISFFQFCLGYDRTEQACTRTVHTTAPDGLETNPVPEDHPSQTSTTLLGRLRRDPRDQAAWNEFVARYEPRILDWSRRWGLQESDARDVTQAVLLKLSRSMTTFVYDRSRSFRGWLKTITRQPGATWSKSGSERA